MPVIGQWFCLIVYLSQWIERTVFKLRFFVPSVIAMPVIGRWQMGGRLIVWDYAEKRTVQSQATETDPNTATYNMHIQIYRDKVYCMRLCMQRKVQSSATETDTNTDTDTNALHIHIQTISVRDYAETRTVQSPTISLYLLLKSLQVCPVVIISF